MNKEEGFTAIKQLVERAPRLTRDGFQGLIENSGYTDVLGKLLSFGDIKTLEVFVEFLKKQMLERYGLNNIPLLFRPAAFLSLMYMAYDLDLAISVPNYYGHIFPESVGLDVLDDETKKFWQPGVILNKPKLNLDIYRKSLFKLQTTGSWADMPSDLQFELKPALVLYPKPEYYINSNTCVIWKNCEWAYSAKSICQEIKKKFKRKVRLANLAEILYFMPRQQYHIHEFLVNTIYNKRLVYDDFRTKNISSMPGRHITQSYAAFPLVILWEHNE
jgi:hypothetical protein